MINPKGFQEAIRFGVGLAFIAANLYFIICWIGTHAAQYFFNIICQVVIVKNNEIGLLLMYGWKDTAHGKNMPEKFVIRQ